MEVLTSSLAALPQSGLPAPLVASIFVATTVLVVLARRRAARATSAPSRNFVAKLNSQDRARKQVESDLRDTMIELETLARQINGQIETKFRMLEAVIRDADERIAKLARLEHGGAGASGLDITLGGDGSLPESVPHTPLRSRIDRAAVFELADAGHGVEEIARRLSRAEGEIKLLLALRSAPAGSERSA